MNMVGGYFDVVLLLLWYGSNIDAQDDEGQTPLIMSAREKKVLRNDVDIVGARSGGS